MIFCGFLNAAYEKNLILRLQDDLSCELDFKRFLKKSRHSERDAGMSDKGYTALLERAAIFDRKRIVKTIGSANAEIIGGTERSAAVSEFNSPWMP